MIRTWHIEAAVVAVVLAIVAALGGGGVEFVGAAAVLGAFMHGQIADRLHEQQCLRPTVECLDPLAKERAETTGNVDLRKLVEKIDEVAAKKPPQDPKGGPP